MKQHALKVTGLAVLLTLTACGETTQEAVLHQASGEKIEGQYIVVYEDHFVGLQEADIQPLQTYHEAFQGFAAELSQEKVQKLLKTKGIKAIYESVPMYPLAIQQNPTWGIDRLDQESKSLDKKYQYKNSGEGVTSYIVDTGILGTHLDFGSRVVQGIDITVDKGTTKEFRDGVGHGTHVAGTVGSNTYGVAKKTTLIAVKVFPSQGGSASDADVIAGIDWAIEDFKKQGKPAVMNLSLGGEASQVLDDALQKAIDAGITVVVAAGNDNKDACLYSPARLPQAITVAATTSSDAKSSFSNWGKCVDVMAPGSAITSTWNDGRTKSIQGTSMASPHVAGVAALYLSQNPSAKPQEVDQFLKEKALKNKISGFNSATANLFISTMWNLPDTQPEPTPQPTAQPTAQPTVQPTAQPPQQGWSKTYKGNIQEGTFLYFPESGSFQSSLNTKIEASLSGSFWNSGCNFDLYIQKQVNGSWQEVASSTYGGTNESLSYMAESDGIYRIAVKSVRSTSSYTLYAKVTP